MKLEKEEQIKLKAIRRNEMMRIRMKISAVETRKRQQNQENQNSVL